MSETKTPTPPETKTPTAEKVAELYEIKSVCGDRLNHPYLGVWFDESWSKPLPMDSWLELQVKGEKLAARPARD